MLDQVKAKVTAKLDLNFDDYKQLLRTKLKSRIE